MDDAICLEDGLVVYAREGIYQMRLRVSPQRYIWRSLKTRDKEQAIRTARREFYKLEIKKEEGEEYAAPTLKKVLADYLKQRELENKRGDTKDGMLRQIKRVQKFWLEYAGNKPSIRLATRNWPHLSIGGRRTTESLRSCRKTPSCTPPTRPCNGN